MKKVLNFILAMIASMFHSMRVYAATTVVTAGGAGNGGTLFSDLVRTVYSKEIEYKALPVMRFMQFAQIKTELGVDPGLTITMLVYDNLTMGGSLVENVPMQTQALSGSTRSITVKEYGNAVQVSELTIQASFDDVMANATTVLGRDYALVVDCELRDAALSGTNIVYARKNDGTEPANRAALIKECGMKVSAVKDAIEILSTNNAPKVDGAFWICFLHPHQSRILRDDSAWINASNYGAPEQQFSGEIGRIDDCRFIETTLMCNGASAATEPSYDADLHEAGADDCDVYQAVLFGDAYYAMAVSLPVELRDNGVIDFGRTRALGWYSIFGVSKLHDGYGVVIETA